MDYRKLHKIISRIFSHFENWHIYICPLEDDSWDFNICFQKLTNNVNYSTSRIDGIQFSITPELKEDRVFIEIDHIVVRKTHRKEGIASNIVKLLLDAIGRKNISKIALIDISGGFWEKMSKKHKTVQWVFY